MNEDRVSELLREADCVPQAPDCRAAVMERIRAPRRRSLAWAYVCAAIAVAIVGTWALVPCGEQRPAVPKIVKKALVQPKAIARDVAPDAGRFGAKNSPGRPDRVKSIAKVMPSHRRHATYAVYAPPKRTAPPKKVVVAPEPVVVRVGPSVSATNIPVAIAIVTWPSRADQQSDSQSYSYTDRDTRTGTTTECRVKRSGDSVEIYMESKPEAKQPPVKGSTGYETKPSA